MEQLSIGRKIKELRIRAGFTQSMIAEYLQVEPGLISEIENGEREVSTDAIKKLAALFGCTVSAIVNDEEDISCLNVAFCTSGMSKEDLNSIAVINRLASNIEDMQRMSERPAL